jgi:hypothetical protein
LGTGNNATVRYNISKEACVENKSCINRIYSEIQGHSVSCITVTQLLISYSIWQHFVNTCCDWNIWSWRATTSMGQSPWGANNYWPNEEISSVLWQPRFINALTTGPLLVAVPSQMHPVHTFPTHVPKIPSNIILPFMTKSCDW